MTHTFTHDQLKEAFAYAQAYALANPDMLFRIMWEDPVTKITSKGKWKKFEDYTTEKQQEINYRNILKNEVIIDLDLPNEKDAYKKLIPVLDQMGLHYSIWYTGGNGTNAHMFFDREITGPEKIALNKKVQLAAGIPVDMKAITAKGSGRLIGLELGIHRRTKKQKVLLIDRDGFSLNKFPDIPVEKRKVYPKSTGTSAPKELCFGLEYALTNKLEPGARHNDISKNLYNATQHHPNKEKIWEQYEKTQDMGAGEVSSWKHESKEWWYNGVVVHQYFSDIRKEDVIEECGCCGWIFYGKTGSKLAHRYSEKLIRDFTLITSKKPKETFYFSKEHGHYISAEYMIRDLAQREIGERGTKNMIQEVLARIQNKTFVDTKELTDQYLPLKNGVYDVHQKKFFSHECLMDKGTGQLIEKEDGKDGVPYYENIHLFSVLNIDYDPEAKCPEFEKFIEQLMTLPDGTTNEEGKRNLWRFVGLCFWRTINDRWINFFIGETGTGKTTYINAITDLIGVDNCSSEDFHTLIEDEHSSAELENMWVNFGSEVEKVAVKDAAKFLKMAGRSRVSGHKKFGQRSQFYVFTKFGFDMNELPEIADPSGAFASRITLTEFCNVFPQGLKGINEKELFSKILTKEEKSGIFNRAMIEMDHFRNGGNFEKPPIKEMQELLIERSNSITSFLTNCVHPDPTSVILKNSVFPAYLAYCAREKRTPGSINKLFSELPNRFPGNYGEARPKIDGIQKRVVKGVAIEGGISTISNSSQNIREGKVYTNKEKEQSTLLQPTTHLENKMDKVDMVAHTPNAPQIQGSSVAKVADMGVVEMVTPEGEPVAPPLTEDQREAMDKVLTELYEQVNPEPSELIKHQMLRDEVRRLVALLDTGGSWGVDIKTLHAAGFTDDFISVRISDGTIERHISGRFRLIGGTKND